MKTRKIKSKDLIAGVDMIAAGHMRMLYSPWILQIQSTALHHERMYCTVRMFNLVKWILARILKLQQE